MKKLKIAYQGVSGAYSHMAAQEYFGIKDVEFIGFPTFKDAIDTTKDNKTDIAFLPVENSTAGRVASMHLLLPSSKLHIIGEYLFCVNHQLISNKDANRNTIKKVYSHPQALAQSLDFIHKHNLQEIPFGDTAAAVEYISKMQDDAICAIGSEISASIYPDVKILYKNINTNKDNTTRFLVLSKSKLKKNNFKNKKVRTSIFYKTKNIPAALYKSMSGFATNNINILKLESFMPLHKHESAMFYLEFRGGVDTIEAKQAMLELSYYAQDIQILGTYVDDSKR